MCGRISLSTIEEEISHFYDGLTIPFEIKPRYNIAPSQNILAIKTDNEPAMLRWGLIPHWAKDKSIGYKMINARAETVAEKPSFRAAYRSRRCLIPADGFYEWVREGKKKQPFHIRREDKGLFSLAGLWETWTCKDSGENIESCTIITTGANDLLKPIHHRMPVIIQPENHDQWLADADTADLLLPYEWENYLAVPVSTYVNNARNEGPECIEKIS